MVDLNLVQAVIAGKAEEVSRTRRRPRAGHPGRAGSRRGPRRAWRPSIRCGCPRTDATWWRPTGSRSSTWATPRGSCSTGWTGEEARRYLEDRAAKGFTVIQAVVLAERDGLSESQPLRPPAARRRRSPAAEPGVLRARRLRRRAGPRPSGSRWACSRPGATSSTRGSTSRGRRSSTRPTPRCSPASSASATATAAVLFILGGDRNPETDEDFAIVRAMGRALKADAPRATSSPTTREVRAAPRTSSTGRTGWTST